MFGVFYGCKGIINSFMFFISSGYFLASITDYQLRAHQLEQLERDCQVGLVYWACHFVYLGSVTLLGVKFVHVEILCVVVEIEC